MPVEHAPPAAGAGEPPRDPPRRDPWATPDDTWSELLAEVYASRPFRRVRRAPSASRPAWRALAPTAFRCLAAPRRGR